MRDMRYYENPREDVPQPGVSEPLPAYSIHQEMEQVEMGSQDPALRRAISGQELIERLRPRIRRLFEK